MILAAVLGHRQWRPMSSELSRITPRIIDFEQFPTEVSVRRRGVLLGQDQGTISFVDGWLYFEGLHTQFSFRESDVLKMKKGRNRTYSLLFEERAMIVVRADRAESFACALINWRTSRLVPEGSAQFPPILPHHSALHEPTGRLLIGTTLVAMAGWGLYALLTFHSIKDIEAFVFLAFFVIVGLIQIARGFRGLAVFRPAGLVASPLQSRGDD